MKTISIVIPMYNEEQSAELFYQTLTATIDTLPYLFEIIFVNDGSSDQTQIKLANLAQNDARIQILELSRNFGHQAALCAGMESATGDLILTMDGDGQHPAGLIPEMIRLCENGYDVVQTQRLDDGGEKTFKKRTSAFFYKVINKIGDTRTIPGGADFRLMTRQVVDNLIAMPEYHRFLRGMVPWLGFKSVILPFRPQTRIAGESKYSLNKMLRLASDAVFSFSMLPLYIGLSSGALFLILAIVEVVYVLSFWVSGRSAELSPGWSSLMFMMLIIAAVLMFILGFIGVYVGYIFQEVKHRPVYIIKNQNVRKDEELFDEEEK